MTRIIAVANQKGGVGKTTTSINLAASVASRGYRVLLVDFDPQGNASSGVGYPHNKIELSIYDALAGDVSIEDTIRPTEITTLFVVPATMDLVGAEIELIGADSRERYLANALEPVAASYDYVIIDCPPSLGLLTLNALVAADGVVVPMQAEYFALEGLSALTKTIEKVRQAYNPHLAIDGVVFTMFDGRLSLANQVRLEVANYFGDKVFSANIPRNVRLSEAPSHGKPCLLYDLRCVGTSSYLALADELLDRTLMVQAPAPQASASASGSGSTPAPAAGSGSVSGSPAAGVVAKPVVASATVSKPVSAASTTSKPLALKAATPTATSQVDAKLPPAATGR